jgi:hypothetical protein
MRLNAQKYPYVCMHGTLAHVVLVDCPIHLVQRQNQVTSKRNTWQRVPKCIEFQIGKN